MSDLTNCSACDRQAVTRGIEIGAKGGAYRLCPDCSVQLLSGLLTVLSAEFAADVVERLIEAKRRR